MKEFLLGVVMLLFPCIVALLISVGGMFIHLDVTYMNPLEWKEGSRVALVFGQGVWLVIMVVSWMDMN